MGAFALSQSNLLECGGGSSRVLYFYKWLPFGFVNVGGADPWRPDCQGNNQAYNMANGNTWNWWGWTPLFNLFDAVFQQVQAAQLQMDNFDIENEVNVMDFTVLGRLIYDNSHLVNVLNEVRTRLANRGFNSGRATYSVTNFRPSGNYDCGSVYGDSAMIIKTSELTGAIAGPWGLFGFPPIDGTLLNQTNLPCGPQNPDLSQMISLPVFNTQPSVTDVHANICITVPGNQDLCTSSSSQTVAQWFHTDVWSYLTYRGLTGNLVIYGETNSNQNCEGDSPARATDNVNGYKQSTLYTNHKANVTFRPWQDSKNTCYSPPKRINPPYDSQTP